MCGGTSQTLAMFRHGQRGWQWRALYQARALHPTVCSFALAEGEKAQRSPPWRQACITPHEPLRNRQLCDTSLQFPGSTAFTLQSLKECLAAGAQVRATEEARQHQSQLNRLPGPHFRASLLCGQIAPSPTYQVLSFGEGVTFCLFEGSRHRVLHFCRPSRSYLKDLRRPTALARFQQTTPRHCWWRNLPSRPTVHLRQMTNKKKPSTWLRP